MGVTSCNICHKPVMDDDGPIGDVVDAFKYDIEGYLDYIVLFHRRCAVNKGYKVNGKGHIVGAEPRGRDVQEHIDEAEFTKSPTTYGGFGGDLRNVDAELEWIARKIASLQPQLAKRPSTAKQIRDLERQKRERELAVAFSHMKESQQVGEYPQVNEMMPEPGEQNPIKETSDAAPAISNNESVVPKRFGSVIIEMLGEAHGPIEWEQLVRKAQKEWGIDVKDIDFEGLKFELKTAKRFSEKDIQLPMKPAFKGNLPRIPIEDAENIIKNHQGFVRGMKSYVKSRW